MHGVFSKSHKIFLLPQKTQLKKLRFFSGIKRQFYEKDD